MRLDFQAGTDPVVGILSGQRGVLPISADERFAIAVEGRMKILLLRIKTGA